MRRKLFCGTPGGPLKCYNLCIICPLPCPYTKSRVFLLLLFLLSPFQNSNFTILHVHRFWAIFGVPQFCISMYFLICICIMITFIMKIIKLLTWHKLVFCFIQEYRTNIWYHDNNDCICSHLHINLTFTNIALQGAGGGNDE